MGIFGKKIPIMTFIPTHKDEQNCLLQHLKIMFHLLSSSQTTYSFTTVVRI